MPERITTTRREEIETQVRSEVIRMKGKDHGFKKALHETNIDPADEQKRLIAQNYLGYYSDLEKWMVEQRMSAQTNSRGDFRPRQRKNHGSRPHRERPSNFSVPPKPAEVKKPTDQAGYSGGGMAAAYYEAYKADGSAPDSRPDTGPGCNPIWETASLLYNLRKPLMVGVALLLIGSLCINISNRFQSNTADRPENTPQPTPILQECDVNLFRMEVVGNSSPHNWIATEITDPGCRQYVDITNCITAEKDVDADTLPSAYYRVYPTPYTLKHPLNTRWVMKEETDSPDSVSICTATLNEQGAKFLDKK